MRSFRAWPSLLWAFAFMCLGCSKGADSGSELPSDEELGTEATEAEDRSESGSSDDEVQLPFGMDLEKGIPPWYFSGAGKISVERVRKGIHDHGMTLTECNKRWDPGPGDHSALILLRFTIGEEGHISELSAAESRGGDPALTACIVEGMGTIEFDPPPVGGPVTYEMPLYFAKR